MGVNGEKKNIIKRAYEYNMSALKRVFRWLKRAFCGSKAELQEEERIESPTRLILNAFFRKKAAVAALLVLVGLFLFVFIAPMLVQLDVNYTDPLQQNLAPVYSLKRVPKRLKKEIEDIDGFSGFTVGLSKQGKVFVWGNTQDTLSGRDMKDIPQQVKEEGAVLVAAGKDHVLALTKSGDLVGWGDDSCGQYGVKETLNALSMPSFLTEKIAVEEVKELACGYQASALVMADGNAYLWGNMNTVRNLFALNTLCQNGARVEKVVFSNSAAIALTKEGKIETGAEGLFLSAMSMKNGRQNSLNAYLVGRKVVDIAADNKCIALTTEEGDLVVAGAFENGEAPSYPATKSISDCP